MKSQFQRMSRAVRLIGVAGVSAVLGAYAQTAKADDYAYYLSYYYASSTQQGGGTYGRLDLDTGLSSQIASFTPPCCNGSNGYTGLGVTNGELYSTTLYGAGTHSSLLAVPDAGHPQGTTSVVGTDTGRDIADFGSSSSGLYAVGQIGNLLSINPTTGTSTVIGATGFVPGNFDFSGMSADGKTLYLTLSNTLYSLNTSTGVATEIGSTGDFEFGAMVYEGGKLYGAGFNNAQVGAIPPFSNIIGEINPLTGAVSDVVTVAGDLPSADFIVGLADTAGLSTSVPEPTDVGLLGLGIAGLVWRRKRVSR
jgi:hypothetical protein